MRIFGAFSREVVLRFSNSNCVVKFNSEKIYE